MIFDLHVHTNESDGKYSKLTLLKYANDKKFEAIAFCDHNICNNVNANIINERFKREYGTDSKTIFIPAIEIDAYNDIYRRIHILGYGIVNTSLIMEQLERIKKQNVIATKRQIELINQLYNTKLTEEYVELIEGTKDISAEGLKKALINLGIAKDIRDTYRYVSYSSNTHVERKKLTDKETIKLIKAAGGVAILAHPIEISNKKTKEKLGHGKEYEQYLEYLIECGIDGVESHTIKHNRQEQNDYYNLNKKFQLISTAGTDFHDETRTPILGINYNPEIFLYPLLEKIEERNSEIIKGDNKKNEER